MDGETLKWAASLGVGGILAALMFMVYRKDAQQWQEAWRGQTQMLLQVVKENTTAVEAWKAQTQLLLQVVQENTEAVNTLIEKLHKR